MMKRWILLPALLLALTLCTCASAEYSTVGGYLDEETGNIVERDDLGLFYTVLEDGAILLDDVSCRDSGATITLPSEIAGHPVTWINGDSVLWGLPEAVTTVVIPASVRGIRNDMAQYRLPVLRLSDTLRDLRCLGETPLLEVQDGLVYQGDTLVGCLNATNLPRAVIREGAVRADLSLFAYCEKLESLGFPATLTDVDGLSGYLPMTLAHIVVQEGNPVFSDEDGVLYQGNTLLCLPSRHPVREFIVRPGTTEIASWALNNCDQVEWVTLPDTLETIHEGAFFSCGKLHSINLPAALVNIHEGAFRSCWALKEVALHADNPAYRLEQHLLVENATDTLISAFWSEEDTCAVPQGVTRIGEYAFTCCASLEEATLPPTVTTIGRAGFAFTGLKRFTLPVTVTEIGAEAFCLCEDLASFDFEGGQTALTAIPEAVFRYSALTAIHFPADCAITGIGCDAFNSCKDLKEITLPQGLQRLDDTVFYGCVALGRIELPDTLTEIGMYCFADTRLPWLVIPENVAELHLNAISDCGRLQHLFIMGDTALSGYLSVGELNDAGKPKLVAPAGSPAAKFCKENDHEYSLLHRFPFLRGALKVVSTTDEELQALLDDGVSMRFSFEEQRTILTAYTGGMMTVTLNRDRSNQAVRTYSSTITADSITLDGSLVDMSIESPTRVVLTARDWVMVLEGEPLP